MMFKKYQSMRDSGATPVQVYIAAEADGVDQIDLIRMIRETFSLSLREAKEVIATVDGTTLQEREAQLTAALKLAFENEVEREPTKSG